jgi:hypothetical protein
MYLSPAVWEINVATGLTSEDRAAMHKTLRQILSIPTRKRSTV